MQKTFSDLDKQNFFKENYIHAFYCDDKSALYHKHNFFELVYVVSGSAEHSTSDEKHIITKGDYMFMDYSTCHEYTAITEDFAVINCLFLSKAIDKTMPDCDNFLELLKSYQLRLNKIILNDSPVNRFFHDDSGKIEQILYEMCDECGNKATGYIDYMRCLLIQIIISTIRNFADCKEQTYSVPIVKTLKIIEERYASKLQLSDIADELYLSVPYLSTKFKNEVGICITEHIKHIRIQKACMLLVTTDMKISNIAEMVGYGDYKRFGIIFKETTGTSPGRFRNSTKTN